jgi:hypothetical protein
MTCTPHRKQPVSITKNSRLLLFGEIIDVQSQKHTEHMSTLCGKNGNICNLKAVEMMKVNALLNTTAKRHTREWRYS